MSAASAAATRRATALPPEERRASIIAAVLPLLAEHGELVTTRQIADAAGIAEGTIFRVFTDKDELLSAALEAALDQAPLERELGRIDAALPFEQRLIEATRIIQRRVVDIWAIVSNLSSQRHDHARRPLTESPGLVAIFEAERAQLRIDPNAAARMLRALTLSLTHPMLAGRPAEATEIVATMLHGIVRGEADPSGPGALSGLGMSLRQLLRSHMAPYRKLLLIVIGLQTVQTIATLTLPSLNADIIDQGVFAGDNGYIIRTGAVMFGFTIVQILFGAAAVWFGAQVAMGFGRDVRRDLFHSVTDFSAREVGRFGAPSLITRITNDVQQVQILVVTATTMMITAPLMMVFGVLMAVREDAGLAIVLAFAVPLAVLILGQVVYRMTPAFQRMQERVDRVNSVLREQITGIRVVRAFVREPEEVARFGQANSELTATALRTGRLMAFMFPSINAIINISVIGVLWIGADRIGAGQMQVGSLIAYISYLTQILIAVVMVTFMVSMVPRAAVSSERIKEVLDTDSSVVAPSDPITRVAEHGTIEFRDVGFMYPGAEHAVLSDISFRVEAGQTLAIIGSTGSGKTTLVNLVPRLFDSTQGSVLVDGVDVRRLDPDLLWSSIGYVPQKSYLFSGTVASNLRFGRPEATDAELWEALDIAQASDFVRAMPDGLESTIAQGGSNVSGGQRQRLSIARALVVKPEIFVFDDSFSALDLATDARLRAALAPSVRDSAVIIVAQRVSTIATADQILVLDDGRIIGRGTHEELISTSPTYAEIVESQLGEGALA